MKLKKQLKTIETQSLWCINMIQIQVLFNSMQNCSTNIQTNFALCVWKIDHGETSMIISFCSIYMQLFICLITCNWSFIIDTVYFDCMLMLQRTNISIYDNTSRVGITIILTIAMDENEINDNSNIRCIWVIISKIIKLGSIDNCSVTGASDLNKYQLK